MHERSHIAAIANAKKEIGEKQNSEILKEIMEAGRDRQSGPKFEINIDSSFTEEVIERAVFFEDIGGRYKLQAMIDPVSKSISLVNLEILFRKKERKTKEVHRVFFVYDPRMKSITGRDENDHPVVNLYDPPVWRKDEYFFNKEQPIENEILEIYHLFFMHLVDNDLDSYSVIIKWLAYSLIGRNPTYLVLVGGKGTGKGIFGKILQLLHGKKNFMTMTNDTFKTQFNSEIDEHTIGSLDELYLKRNARQQISKLKLLNNEDVRVEKKHTDAAMVKNHMNLYISSNDYEGIPLESDNRRLTIPNCTHKPLKETELIKRVDEIENPENIAKLGRYLLTIAPTFEEMRDPFVSEIVEEKILDSNTKEWETWAFKWFMHSLPGYAEKGEVRLEKFQEDFRKENPHSPLHTLGKNLVERYLNERKELGWILKKHPTNTDKGVIGYRSFEKTAIRKSR